MRSMGSCPRIFETETIMFRVNSLQISLMSRGIAQAYADQMLYDSNNTERRE